MEYQDEVTGSATAMAVDETRIDTSLDNSTQEVSEGTAGGFFSTPAPEMPLPSAKKHRGSVSSVVTLLSKQKGTGGVEITLHSDSNGKDYAKTIWVLDQYRENPNLDPETLKGIPAAEGKVQTPFERYGRTIQNKKGTGELQQLINAGTAAGRTFARYTDFTSLGEVLNAALQGTPVIFTDRAVDTETGFKVEVNTIYAYTHDFSKLRAEAADGSAS